MHPADDRRHVMLAMRLETNIAQHHYFVVAAGFLEGSLEIIARIVVITGEPFLIGANDPRRRGEKSLAIGIVAGPANERAHGNFSFRARRPPDAACRRRFVAFGFVIDRLVHKSFSGRHLVNGNWLRGPSCSIGRRPYNRRSATSSTWWLSLFFRIRSARWRVGTIFSRKFTRLIRFQMSVAVSTASPSDRRA